MDLEEMMQKIDQLAAQLKAAESLAAEQKHSIERIDKMMTKLELALGMQLAGQMHSCSKIEAKVDQLLQLLAQPPDRQRHLTVSQEGCRQ